MANTEEFEAEWHRSRPPKLPWVLLGAVVLVGGWASCSLKSQKDEADAQLRTTHDQLDTSQKKLVDLVAQKNTLERRVSDLEREKQLLADRKAEPVKEAVKDDPKKKAAPAKPTSTKHTTKPKRRG